MEPLAIIELVAIILTFGGSLIGIYLRLNNSIVKLETEIQLKFKEYDNKLEKSEGLQNSSDNENKYQHNRIEKDFDSAIDKLERSNDLAHEKIIIKLDDLTKSFNDFKVYIEKRFNNLK